MISFTDEDRRFFISEKKEGDTLGIYSQIVVRQIKRCTIHQIISGSVAIQ